MLQLAEKELMVQPSLLDPEFMNRCQMAIEHVAVHHGYNADGYIVFAVKRTEFEMKQSANSSYPFKQMFFKYEDLVEALPSLLATYYDRDVYISANTMWKRRRASEGIRHMRCIFADLDTYKIGMTPTQALLELEKHVFGKVLPWPSRVVFSGRGLWLYWDIEPVPQINKADIDKNLPPEQRRSPQLRWAAVQRQFNYLLREYGADFQSIDATRVCRLAGTFNSKSGELAECVVYDDELRFSLADLKDQYVPVLPDPPVRKKREKKATVHVLNTEMNFFYRLKRDLEKLFELRGGNINGAPGGWEDGKAVTAGREYFLFMYRMASARVHGDSKRALEETLEMNAKLTKPLPVKEVHGCTNSHRSYFYKPGRVIELFGITIEEQQEMEYLVGPIVKKERKRERDREYRAERRLDAGVVPRDERKAADVELLASAIATAPDASLSRLAGMTGLSRSKCFRLKQEAEEVAFQKSRSYIVEDCKVCPLVGGLPSTSAECPEDAFVDSSSSIASLSTFSDSYTSESLVLNAEEKWYECLELLEDRVVCAGVEASFELLLRSVVSVDICEGILVVVVQNDFVRVVLERRFLDHLNVLCAGVGGIDSVRFVF